MVQSSERRHRADTRAVFELRSNIPANLLSETFIMKYFLCFSFYFPFWSQVKMFTRTTAAAKFLGNIG